MNLQNTTSASHTRLYISRYFFFFLLCVFVRKVHILKFQQDYILAIIFVTNRVRGFQSYGHLTLPNRVGNRERTRALYRNTINGQKNFRKLVLRR